MVDEDLIVAIRIASIVHIFINVLKIWYDRRRDHGNAN